MPKDEHTRQKTAAAIRQRYRNLFDLARQVAGITPRPGEVELRAKVEEWNRLSEWPADGRWQERLFDQFLAALGRVTKPKKERFPDIVEESRSIRTPACVQGESDPRRVELAKVCLAMEREYKAPWSLSVRQAAEALGVSRTHAHRLLGALKKADVIELVCRGKRGPRSKKATTWRFVGQR